MASIVTLLLVLILFFSLAYSQGNALSLNYFTETCPDVDSVISRVVREETVKDKTVPAAVLRMHFHDCFIRECDGSGLLNSKGGNKAEKDGPPNVSLHAFYVIDNAKKAVVSCADILALAARAAVMLSGGPACDVPKGRKDGRISKASETFQLPAPTFNISQLRQSFSQRDLSLEDLVALSSSLKSICPLKNLAKNAGTNMDPSSTTFDNTYYKLILQKRGLFSSDQELLTFPKTNDLVSKYASSKNASDDAFVNSMIKISIIGGQEVRKDCRVVNRNT